MLCSRFANRSFDTLTIIFVPEIFGLLIDIIKIIPDIFKQCKDGFKKGWYESEQKRKLAGKEKREASVITVEISQEIAESLKEQDNQRTYHG